MALLGGLFNKSKDPTFEFRGKPIGFHVTEDGGVRTMKIGVDGKLKNAWNEPVWVRVINDTGAGKISIVATKAHAADSDGKVLYANYSTFTHPDFFPLEDSEVQQLITQLNNSPVTPDA